MPNTLPYEYLPTNPTETIPSINNSELLYNYNLKETYLTLYIHI